MTDSLDLTQLLGRISELEKFAREHGTSIGRFVELGRDHEDRLVALEQWKSAIEIARAREDERDQALRESLKAIDRSILAASESTKAAMAEVKQWARELDNARATKTTELLDGVKKDNSGVEVRLKRQEDMINKVVYGFVSLVLMAAGGWVIAGGLKVPLP